ncbi:MAG: GTPase [Gemmataceae bacterium]
MDTRQTIVALATPAGPAARAIIRLSGQQVRPFLAELFDAELRPGFAVSGSVRLPDLPALPASVLFAAEPHSYTGQDVAEIHLPGCGPIVDRLLARLIEAGCRPAQPGEFTQRAFLAGKLDLPRAEAVHAIIAAQTRGELRAALSQLAGGLSIPLRDLRESLLDLLADLEAGLDFADEDISFLSTEQLLQRLTAALARVTLLGKQLDSRSLHPSAFRVALVGYPNAGKSSLFNALVGGAALVSELPGTTRDYLTARLELGELVLELIDTPGLMADPAGVDAQALALARTQYEQADLLLVCIESGRSPDPVEARLLQRMALWVATKCDLAAPPESSAALATSVTHSIGLRELRSALLRAARERQESALATSLARCRGHADAALNHLRTAHHLALEQGPPELIAMEVRLALEALGHVAGTVYTDDLLDRIFSRFCIGK